jgi:hypothetical protein
VEPTQMKPLWDSIPRLGRMEVGTQRHFIVQT